MPMSAALKIILFVTLAYCAIVAVVFVLQRNMLYFPNPQRPSEELAQSAGLAFWPASAGDYRGFVSVDPVDAVATVVVLHGNAGRAVDRSYYADALAPLGYRVLLAEYPGYGGRSGKPSEATFVADAKETVELAYKEYGDPIYLWGESLGAGVAAAVVASIETPIAGLVLVTPWDSLPDLAQAIYWFFPTRWLIRDQYDSVKNLASYAGPVAVVVAEQDEIIPTQHSLRLFESVGDNKKLWMLEGAGHNSWPVQPNAPWWREVVDFVSVARD